MKKLVAVVLIVIIALAAFWVARRPALKMPFADMFPAGAIGYVGVHKGAAQVRDLTNSNFWKKLSGIESIKEFTREARSKLEERGETASSLGTLAALLGEDAATAFYGSETRFGRSIIAAVRSDEEGQALFTLVKTALGGKAAGSYRGRELYSFRLPPPVGFEGAYAGGGGVSIAAVSKSNPMDLVKAAIDLGAGEGGRPLSADKNFMALMGKPLRGAGTLVGCACFDVKTLEKELQGLKAAIVKRVSEKNPAAATTLANVGMGQIPCLSWGGYLYRHQGLAGKLHMRLDEARLSAEQRALLGGGTGKLDLLGFVPRGTIAVSDSRMGNVSAVWKWYKTQTWPARAINILSLCEKQFGVDFERDVLPWLGEEICLQISDVVTGGLLPTPRVQLVMSVKDRKAAERSLASMMEHIAQPPPAQTPKRWAFLKPEIRDEEYKGEKIKTLAYPIPGISPSFTFRDGFLIVGLDRSSVQMVVDVAGGAGDALVSETKFAGMKKMLPDRLHELIYVDCERACGTAEGLLRWFLSVKRLTTASDDPEKAKELERIESDLPQLFAALKAFRALMTASVVGEDAMDQYFVLRMRDM
jgi:hypothetical protein